MIKRLWRLDPGGHLAIVTFNQDLVIEKALEAAKSLRRYAAIPWSLRNCYGVDFQDSSLQRTPGRHLLQKTSHQFEF